MGEEAIYDDNYFASFSDPLLSKKLLRFSEYPNEDQAKQQLIESIITKDVYGYEPQLVYYNGVAQKQNPKPIYYQGTRYSNIELNQFKESPQFPIFSRELEQCFTYINQWIIEQKLNLEYMERSGLGEEMLRIIPAQDEFDHFLNRLKTGYYEEFETDMYGDGKKYLEKLAVLIHDNDIDLSFRKNQIISLLSDEGLRRCMGGCLTVLEMAVANLENYGVYRPDRLVLRFFSDILKTTTIKAPKFHGPNVISQISKVINIDPSISEVHIYNYLLQRAKIVFGLNSLTLAEDVHINLITDPYSSDNRIKVKIDVIFYHEYLTPIKNKLRTADLVNFIANQIREKLQTDSINSLEEINKLELWLSELGRDNSFNREDFFVVDNTNYKLKLDFALEITITERLFDTGWLELDLLESSRLFKRGNNFFERNKGIFLTKPNLPFIFQPFKLMYKIYYSNLELSWVRINEKKYRILDFVSTKDNLPQLINVMGSSQHLLINSLLQTPNDMSLFFQFLASGDLSTGLSWVNSELSTSFVTPSDKTVVWMYQFTQDSERYRKILESVNSNVQKRLFLHLIENSQPFQIRLQVILDQLVKLPSRSQKELHNIMQLKYGVIYEILNNLFSLDIRNFSGLTFPYFHCKKCLISMSSPIYTYLMHINFENCNFDNAIFNTYIKNCKFNKANLHHTKFMKSVISSSFENTDLTTTQFMGSHFMYLNLYGAIFSTQSFLTLMQRTHTMSNQASIADFRGADLRQVDFQNPAIQRELAKRIIDFSNALLQDTNLSGLFRRETNIVLLGQAILDGAQLRKCKLADIHTMFTSMKGVVTDETVLSIDQLFQLYHQGHRDFSTDYIADTGPRANFFNHETLSGALISPQIFLTLVNDGFKNFDQAQLISAPRIMRNQHHLHLKLLTSRSLQDRRQRVRLERLELGQRKFQELQEIISETLNYRQISKLHVLNQAELFHSYLFKAKNLEIHGRCVQLTSAFSEALIRNKQEVYKKNLHVISELDKRVILRKPLSKREQNDRKKFLEAMRQFEENSVDNSVTLPSWIHDKTLTIKDIDSLVEYIEYLKQDFAWHISLIESKKQIGHVLGVYYVEGKYAFFDSNVGYIDNINDKETFVSFLKRIIKRSYLIHSDMKIYVDQYTPDIEVKKNPKINDAGLDNKLFTVFLTEQQRLSKLDESGYLVINNQLVDRKTLYKIGFSYHEDGNLNLPGRLIDSEMGLDQKFLDNGLKDNKFSINSYYFQEFLLKYIQEEKKSLINQSVTRRRYSVDIRTLNALLSLPTYQMFKNSVPIKTLEPLFDSFSSTLKRRTDLRTINKVLKKTVSRSEIFTTQLEKNQFQKGLIQRLQGIGKKVPLPKALAGLIVSKSFFDIGLSIAQNNYQSALLQSLMLSYGLFAEPWIEQSIINLPKKLANFINTHSSVVKISDKLLDAKRIVIPTRLFAGTAANVLDIVSLSSSINQFMESEYGKKKWRDAIADITIDSASIFTGSALVLANPSFGVGLGAGIFLIIVKSSYDGASLLMEYNAHNLTWAESIGTFLYGSIGLSAPERVLYLHGRQEQMDTLVDSYWKTLQILQKTFSNQNILAYGGGLGEFKKDNEKSYREKTLNPINDKIRKINNGLGTRGKIPFLTESVGDINPGTSAILPYNTPANFKENISRITPKKPDEKNTQYLCLPTFRNESIEIQSNVPLKKTIPEVIFSCTNAVVMLDTRQLYVLNKTKYKKVILNMKYIYDGLIQKIPDFENTFFIFNGTTTFVASSNYSHDTRDRFFIKMPFFSGNILLEGETNSLLVLEDNSDIRTFNITLLPDNIIMDVTSETFTGDVQGKFETKNVGWVVGRNQRQDKYSCHYPSNDSIPFSIELEGLGGASRKPDIYRDCLNVMLHASSHYQLEADSNNTDYKWGSAHISVNANQAGAIVIKPTTNNIDELEVQAIHFRDLNLLRDSRLSYCVNKNQLLIRKEFLSNSEDISLEKLDIQLEYYWNFEKQRSNYIFYDQFDHLITPLLTNDFINSFKSVLPTNTAECFHPQKFLLNRALKLTDQILLNPIKNLFDLVELEEAIENPLYNETIIGPFELNLNLKPLSFVEIQPHNYTLSMGNSDKNVFNLISNKNKLSSFYGDKDEDHYYINLHDISGEKLIKINNYDSDSSIDRLEIYTNHSLYELCIDKRVDNDNNFIFYIINRHEEKFFSCPTQKQPACCSSYHSIGPHVAKILVHNYLLSDVYQHIEICISKKNEDIKCFIPFFDKDKTEPQWIFKRYFRNPNIEDVFFKLDFEFSDIIVEGSIADFESVQREDDLILMKNKKTGGVDYNALSLWFPNYYVNPGNWDLFHLYTTKNATTVNSRMRDSDNNFFREISKIAIDYQSLENNLRFYELSFEDKNSNLIISHNQLQSNIMSRNRREILSISKLAYEIGYLEISNNESFSLIDINVESNDKDLYLSVFMNQTSISTVHSYGVIVKNWDKPENRLSGLLYRKLSIPNLNTYDLSFKSIRWMQSYIHEKILEQNIDTILESDLETKLIWDKLRIFLLLPLPSKNYDTLEILSFMQKILGFENIEEVLDFLPDNSEDSRNLLNHLNRQISESETLAKKIKGYLVYHVIKACFFGYKYSKQIIKDSFPMIAGSFIDIIYSNVRNKLVRGHLWQTSEYIEELASPSEDQIILNKWLNVLISEASGFQRLKRDDKAKVLVLPSAEKYILISDRVGKDKKQHSVIEGSDNFKSFSPIITEEAVTSSATRPESWLNSLFTYFLNVKSDFNPSVFALDRPNDPASKESILLEHCFQGVSYGGHYREEGITCYSKNIKVILFPKENTTIIATPEDTYSKPLCPIEFNGRSAVYFEGEQTHAFYVPEIPLNPLDQFNDKLILFQVLLHEGKKVYYWFKNFFTGKSDHAECIAEKSSTISINNSTKILWKEHLNHIEKQLSDVNRLARGKVDLRWIKHIVEDRKEEFNHLNQLTEQNSETISAFTENLQALQVELAKIKQNICFVIKTDNTDNFTHNKEAVWVYRPKPCFFNKPKENLGRADCNVIGLNARRLEPKSNELNTLLQPFFRK